MKVAPVKSQPHMKKLKKTVVKKKDDRLISGAKGKKLKANKKKKLKEVGEKVSKGKKLAKSGSGKVKLAKEDDASITDSGVKVRVTKKRKLKELNGKVAIGKKVKKPNSEKVIKEDDKSITESSEKEVRVIEKKEVPDQNEEVVSGEKLVEIASSVNVAEKDEKSVTDSGVEKVKVIKKKIKEVNGKAAPGKKLVAKSSSVKIAKNVIKSDSGLVSSGGDTKESSTHVANWTQKSRSAQAYPWVKRERFLQKKPPFMSQPAAPFKRQQAERVKMKNGKPVARKKLKSKKTGPKRIDEASKLQYDLIESRARIKRIEERERELETDIFGDLTKDDDDGDNDDNKDDALDLFSEKPKAKEETENSLIPDDPYDIHGMVVSEPEKKPAWVDEDDDNIRVMDSVAMMSKARGTRGSRETSTKKFAKELKETFTNVFGATPDWADLNNKPIDDSEEGGDIIRSTGNYLIARGSSVNLEKNILEYKQMANLNNDSYSEGSNIEAIDFSPSLQFALVAGKDFKHLGAATLFQVDGNNNHRIHSTRFPSFPVSCAGFLRDGKRFVVGSDECNHIYVCNMETMQEMKISLRIRKTEKSVRKSLYISPDGEIFVHIGNRGKINIYDVGTFSLVDTLEAPFNITSAAFNSDGSRLYTHGMTGEVCIWDMDSRVCIHKFHDDGCIFGTTVAMSPNNQYLACGSQAGIVNIYDSTALSDFAPTPVKVISNLRTSISSLTFNSSSEILAMASNRKPNAMKLIHFPSMTAFENFPKQDREFRNILTLQFSPNSGYFASGNSSGVAHLFRLKHFTNY